MALINLVDCIVYLVIAMYVISPFVIGIKLKEYSSEYAYVLLLSLAVVLIGIVI